MILKSNHLLTLERYLNVNPSHYQECFGELSHSLRCPSGASAALRFHYVRPDGDGEPKFKHLAEMLVAYIVDYCFGAQKAQNPTSYSQAKLFMQARDLFRKHTHSGQAGEILVYFLLESVIYATQVLHKMPITTNPAEERKGGDGLHAKWNATLQLLDVFFAESKLYTDFSSALRSLFESLEAFHSGSMRNHEYFLATHNMRLLDPAAQQGLTDFFTGKAGTNIRTNHACLIGFDWNEYNCLDNDGRPSFLTEFEQRYLAEAQHIRDRVEEKLSSSAFRHFRFEFFIVPFKSVAEFRTWFNEALTG